MPIAITSSFRPFTYDELIKPLIQYKTEYDKVEADYSNLAAQAEAWKNIANREKSPQAYAMYQRYSQELANVVDDFSRGMTMGNRSQLLNMKRRYADDIQPIATAYQRQQTLADEQRKALAANPTMRYERYANDMSLDDFINDPSIDYGRSYSGALLTKQVSDAAASFKSRLTKQGMQGLGLPYQYQILIERGASPDDVLAVMGQDAEKGNPETVKYLQSIVDNVIGSSGVASWADENTMREFRSFANQGLYNAIGESSTQTVTDQAGLAAYKSNLDFNNQVRLMQVKRQMEAQDAANDLANQVRLSSTSYLQASGDLGKYTTALQGLKAGDNGIKASVFGKNGTVNPITVYDQVESAMSSAESRIRRSYESKIRSAKSKAAYEPGGYGAASSEVKRLESQMRSAISSARAEAQKTTLQKYGVTQRVTKDQYDALKAIGYNGKLASVTDFTQSFMAPLNTLAQNRSYYGTNLADYKQADTLIKNGLNSWNSGNTFSGRVYELKSDGSQGKAVSHKDLKLDKNEVTDVGYSALTPKQIIVQMSDGKKYLMDSSVLGTEVYNALNQISVGLQSFPDADLTDASVTGTIKLIERFNNYNPSAPKSSKESIGAR